LVDWICPPFTIYALIILFIVNAIEVVYPRFDVVADREGKTKNQNCDANNVQKYAKDHVFLHVLLLVYIKTAYVVKMASPVQILRKQVEAAYKTSFEQRLIEEIEKGSQESVKWLCILHRELIIRLCSYVKNRSDIQDEIAENCDPIIFKQMLENKVYGLKELALFGDYVYGWLMKFCAPVRDESLKEYLDNFKQACGDCSTGKRKFSEVICEFIMQFHAAMDAVDEDFKSEQTNHFVNFVKDLKK